MLTRTEVGRIRASAVASIRCRVTGVSGQWRLTTSEAWSSASRSSALRPAKIARAPSASASDAAARPIRPGPDHAERLAAKRAAEHEVERERPARLPAEKPVSFGNAAEQRERERDRQLRDRIRQHVGRVRDENVAPARSFEIHVVDADAVVGDDAELAPRAVEQLAVDRRRQHGQDPVDAFDTVGERERIRQRFVHARRKLTGDIYSRRHARNSG